MQEQYYIFQNPLFLSHLLWVVPVLILFYMYARYKRGKTLKAFTGNMRAGRLEGELSNNKRLLKGLLIVIVAGLIILAVARPAWNPKEIVSEQKGRDVVFLLDVSKSMLAEDLKPSRLEASKIAIDETLGSIEGDRVGLVVFAGNATILCPLTVDYSFFKTALDKAGSDSVDVGGTVLADAVRKTINDLLAGSDSKNKDIIIITDGGDQDKADDKFAIEAAREAANMDIRIISIGIGDETIGKRIPYTNSTGEKVFLQYKGEDIITKLNAEVLRGMAKATIGGAYVNVGTSAFDFPSIYTSLVGSAQKSDIDGSKITTYTEGFHYVLLLALILLVGEYLIDEKRQNRKIKEDN